MRLRPVRWLPARPWLGAQRVHIRPSRAGLAFAALLLALWIAAVNYRLGLGYALTYFAFACAIADMLFASRNLAGLSLAAAPGQAVFAGGHALFTLRLINRSARSRHAIQLAVRGSAAAPGLADIVAHGETAVSIGVAAPQRGWLHAPAVRLSGNFPLGLFHAWCHWQPEARVLVYPRAERHAPPLPLPVGTKQPTQPTRLAQPAQQVQQVQQLSEGALELAGVRAYQPGDPLQRLAWRHIARHDGEHLFSKQFEATADTPAGAAPGPLMLDHASLHGLAPEARLSRLAAWVLDAERRSVAYGLRLGSMLIAPGLGPSHRDACLRALALHDLPQAEATEQATGLATELTTGLTTELATGQATGLATEQATTQAPHPAPPPAPRQAIQQTIQQPAPPSMPQSMPQSHQQAARQAGQSATWDGP